MQTCIQCSCTVSTFLLVTCRWNVSGRYVKGLMTDAGLDVREDGMGNIFGRWHGTEPHAGAIQASWRTYSHMSPRQASTTGHQALSTRSCR